MKHTIKSSLIAASAIIFSACGGGDSSTPSSAPETTTGIFVDSPVEAISYECSSGTTGITNSSGEFTCKTGDTITFTLGSFEVGNCTVGEIISPRNLYPNNAVAVTNVAQLLQTLDNDGDPSNGIKIPDNFSELDGVNITPQSASFDTDMATILGKPLVTEAEAEAHLNETLSSLGLENFYLEVSDLAGKKITLDGMELSFYSNMTYKEEDSSELNTGTWSVENGVAIADVTFSVEDSESIVFAFGGIPAVGIDGTYYATQSDVIMTDTFPITAITDLTDDIIPTFDVTVDMLAGKKITLDGMELSFYSNMTYKEEDSSELNTGTWSVENGVAIADVTFSVEDSESIVFAFGGIPAVGIDGTYYATQSDVIMTDTFPITAITDLTDDIIPTFDVTVDMLAGKKITLDGMELSFYSNMTYKEEDSSELNTGTWSVENGVVIANVTFTPKESETIVFTFGDIPAVGIDGTYYATQSDTIQTETHSITTMDNIQ